MSEKIEHTKGPWRWADWHTIFGDTEPAALNDRRTLEAHPANPAEPRVHIRDDSQEKVLTADDPVENEADQILIALAPTAPHLCSIPDCPGNANRERLKLLDEAAELINSAEGLIAGQIESAVGSINTGRRLREWLARAKELKVIE